MWDGSQLAQGNNPYAHAPDTAPAPPGLEELRGDINHSHLVTIYPPAAQLVFAIAAQFGNTTTDFKVFLVVLDILLCAVLLSVLKALNQPLTLAILYAWNPLPILEIAGSGHIDGAAVFFLLSAMLLLLVSRLKQHNSGLVIPAAAVLFAFSVLIKLFPLVFIPALLLLSREYWRRFLIAFTATAMLLCVPFLPDLRNAYGTLDLYLRTWEFAGFAFQVLRDVSNGAFARGTLAVSFLLLCALIYLRLWRSPSPSVVFHACFQVAFCFLLLTTTLHPWYALYLVAFLPLSGALVPGMVFSWVVLLAYQVQISYAISGTWQERSWVAAVIFAAPLFAWIAAALASRSNPGGLSGR
uniref:DUF2029 domain-containing protein n=1 Tax=Marinobacter nauticus TaxID=2743 RepID=A0A455W9B9_MARNT|nr:hypothetical protein YBY_02400 [Marinobacter nauticus]